MPDPSSTVPSDPRRRRSRRLGALAAVSLLAAGAAFVAPAIAERRVVDAVGADAATPAAAITPITPMTPIMPLTPSTAAVVPSPSATPTAAPITVAPPTVPPETPPPVSTAAVAPVAPIEAAPTPPAPTTPTSSATGGSLRPATPAQVPQTSGSTAPGFVSRSGDQLMLDGAPYTFVGLNVYNANSRDNCWYPMHDAELGAAIDASGADVIRAWFFQALARTSDHTSFDFTAFDETLASARSRGVRVVVTLADHWGACETTGVKTTDWYRSGYRTDRVDLPATYRDYVAAVVARYAADPTVLSWQLVNEPESKDASGNCATDGTEVLRGFAADMSSMIRAIDPDHLISLGTIGSGQCGAQGDEYQRLYSDGTLDWCELHDYNGATAFGGDRWNGMDVRVQQCAALGLPVVIGESGVSVVDAGGTDARAALYAAKTAAGAQRGVDGFLAWGWAAGPPAYGGVDDFAITPGDPALAALAAATLR